MIDWRLIPDVAECLGLCVLNELYIVLTGVLCVPGEGMMDNDCKHAMSCLPQP